jgi:hypothetical protein
MSFLLRDAIPRCEEYAKNKGFFESSGEWDGEHESSGDFAAQVSDI